jgi:hypothetical protein
VAFDKTPEHFMSKKTFFILQRIEADGKVIEPAGPDAPVRTAELSDEAAASLLPLGAIAEVPAAAAAKAKSALSLATTTKDAA